ncbi:hypothetical protein EDB83DRAFT_2524279 [Lactarius deliciosus]|nr:hypothetical protein EDB83DRAFT_2526335 [Lactarius deliciosus]KAH9040278.1 hypothetical protein EDB83DRAFT_2524279 [Lactarius deliciosus]
MSDSEIVINVKGPSELKLQLTINTDKTVADLKQAIADKSDVPADRQRLIYSVTAGAELRHLTLTLSRISIGTALEQDDDQLSVYKIQSSHTIHMVKGAARSAPASSSAQSSAPQPLPNMQTGQNVHDPLTQLNSHMGYGAMAGLNPFADMGVNPNDPNMLQSMMNSPEFLQQMSSLMSNPAIFEQALALNPQFAAIGPQAREMFQSDRFRQMMSNPDTLRSMIQMASVMRGAGIDPLGGPLGGPTQSGFPAPGNPNTSQASTASAPAVPGTTPAASGTAPVPNPFGPLGDPSALMQLLGGAGGASGFGSGVGASPLPSGPPPEERFQVQLQQLQDMGFTNASQNVRALLATGGNVHSAIEYILNGGGL